MTKYNLNRFHKIVTIYKIATLSFQSNGKVIIMNPARGSLINNNSSTIGYLYIWSSRVTEMKIIKHNVTIKLLRFKSFSRQRVNLRLLNITEYLHMHIIAEYGWHTDTHSINDIIYESCCSKSHREILQTRSSLAKRKRTHQQ